jgi:hypothetical protein
MKRTRRHDIPSFDRPADIAHHGYLIRKAFGGEYWILKDEFGICSAKTVSEAKNIIDSQLVAR